MPPGHDLEVGTYFPRASHAVCAAQLGLRLRQCRIKAEMWLRTRPERHRNPRLRLTCKITATTWLRTLTVHQTIKSTPSSKWCETQCSFVDGRTARGQPFPESIVSLSGVSVDENYSTIARPVLSARDDSRKIFSGTLANDRTPLLDSAARPTSKEK